MPEVIAALMKALADETRLAVLSHVLTQGEISCQELSKKFSLSQPTMSHHIGKLVDVGVLRIRKEGVAHYYSVNVAMLKGLGINPQKLLATV